MIQETFNWDKLSLIGGLTLQRFYFRLHEGSIRGPQVADFLRELLRHLTGSLLVIWDGAAIHRTEPVKEVLRESRGRLWVERLPAYAAELNPVEYIWGHLKQHEIANLVSRTGHDLSLHATRALRRMRRRPWVIIACWKQSTLWP